MKRREFITLAAGAAAAMSSKPMSAQQVALVVIGVLFASSKAVTSKQLGAFKA